MSWGTELWVSKRTPGGGALGPRLGGRGPLAARAAEGCPGLGSRGPPLLFVCEGRGWRVRARASGSAAGLGRRPDGGRFSDAWLGAGRSSPFVSPRLGAGEGAIVPMGRCPRAGGPPRPRGGTRPGGAAPAQVRGFVRCQPGPVRPCPRRFPPGPSPGRRVAAPLPRPPPRVSGCGDPAGCGPGGTPPSSPASAQCRRPGARTEVRGGPGAAGTRHGALSPSSPRPSPSHLCIFAVPLFARSRGNHGRARETEV